MPLPRVLPAAETVILEVRAQTLADFGPAQLAEYDRLAHIARDLPDSCRVI